MVSTEDLVQISSGDLLQANATIVAGILILLTISIISKKENRAALMLTASSTIFFIGSALLLLLAAVPAWNLVGLYPWALLPFIIGVFYALGAIVFLVYSMTKENDYCQ